ncbi:hypothetical protein B0I37DRAFT_232490 [Chaetomium sp. MPI-CAGE-AT-0009]|nr:hypothetical protein B0I37DRAFT_232490 [Chaetomium sp. MPI-CAGE-AT-0009]
MSLPFFESRRQLGNWDYGSSFCFFFLLVFSVTVHVLSPPRRFWDWDKVCKVCRYFPAGVLARLLTQVLLVFRPFSLSLFVFPCLSHTGQRRMGISMVIHRVGNEDNLGGKAEWAHSAFFQLWENWSARAELRHRHVFVSLWGVHRYRTLMVLTLPFSCLPGPFKEGLYTCATGSVLLTDYTRGGGF